jgi:hypothetical protein
MVFTAAVAALMLAFGSASASAGSKWSTTRCTNTLTKWDNQHPGASSKKAQGYIKHLEKAHGCVFVG